MSKFNFRTLLAFFIAFVAASRLSTVDGAADPIVPGEMAGYLLVPADKVPDTYNAGFSMYVAAWPLLKDYPGHRFQTGLFGTWMHAQYEGPPPANLYSDIEGGLGWWRDTRFPTETPKFIMGGVAPNFSEIANGPGHGAGTWDKPRGQYGVAQLSPWLLFPIDGLNVKTRHLRPTVRVRVSPLPLIPGEIHHRRQKHSYRRQLLDTLFEHRKLQRASCVLHAVFLVPLRGCGPTLGRNAAGHTSRRAQ